MSKPSHTTDAMWNFWLAFKQLEPTVELSGTYENKPGYHNFRNALPPSDYSVQYDLDKQGPGDMAAAIDLTFPNAQAGDYTTISAYSARLLASGRDENDERGNYLREFYGNADLDDEVEGWDFQSVEPASSDDSHLWHIHLSFMRAYVEDPAAFNAILSILKGETVEQWRAGGAPTPTRRRAKVTTILIQPKDGSGILLAWPSDRAKGWVCANILPPGVPADDKLVPTIVTAYINSGVIDARSWQVPNLKGYIPLADVPGETVEVGDVNLTIPPFGISLSASGSISGRATPAAS